MVNSGFPHLLVAFVCITVTLMLSMWGGIEEEEENAQQILIHSS